jgi:hypothetical protein
VIVLLEVMVPFNVNNSSSSKMLSSKDCMVSLPDSFKGGMLIVRFA